ncbi:hypothetical protein [Paracraurococcus lichenis]|uniref:DNA-binding protein n=1 Tax=Paracraurococcus lichenis TaxID=3064888 RepID=A0ABT9EEC2_9PROT|nr:hypothetical protein [Paracraurococcus sp. LOR1-02]MDO9714225.1 hypothetical protein [Paracraurococcus sp. LOR1-02]
MSDSKLPLTDATRELRVPYQRLYQAVLADKVPAVRVGSRWFIERAHLPLVAQALGLEPLAASVSAD